jgi:sulfite exporter TauE/SafE
MFVSGLLGGFGHCIGMCGPVVATYSLGLERRSIASHLFYNLGRITTYSILGGMMGATGSFVGVMKSLERYQHLVLAFTGVGMVVMGVALAGWLPLRSKARAARNSGNAPSAPINFINRVVRSIAGTGSPGAFFPMGLVLGFIPCGLLYTAFIAAAGAGVESANNVEGFLRGMLLLFLFGLGTAPAMFLLGKVVSLKAEWIRGRLYKASAVVMIVAGAMFVYRALR